MDMRGALRPTEMAAAAVLAALLLVVAAFSVRADAAEMLDLYQARPIVTGTGETNRALGFALALEEVLFKVSGDARLYGDPRVKALAKDAGALVESFTYRDRMEGIPIHDEQGSHDRPHDLTVTFARDKIDAALAGLGLTPWTAERPKLVVLLGVTNGEKTFVLSADGEHRADMGESLAGAAFRTNMPALLPSEAMLKATGLSVNSLFYSDPATLAGFAKQVGGDIVLVGKLEFSDKEHGWLTTWRLRSEDGKSYEWHQRGVSFDDAFRNALRGAAQVVSGHGSPG